jgi:OFA family oxalate/formate antiporter-like MFS transporter
MAQQIAGLTPVAAAGIVGVISIFIGLGRIVWAAASDVIGCKQGYFLLYLINACVFLALPYLHTAALFTIAVALVGLCYGGGFGVMRSFAADYFGAKYACGIHGVILLAWAAGAVPSPILIARVHQGTGGYRIALLVIAVMMICSLALPLVVHRPKVIPRLVSRQNDRAIA